MNLRSKWTLSPCDCRIWAAASCPAEWDDLIAQVTSDWCFPAVNSMQFSWLPSHFIPTNTPWSEHSNVVLPLWPVRSWASKKSTKLPAWLVQEAYPENKCRKGVASVRVGQVQQLCAHVRRNNHTVDVWKSEGMECDGAFVSRWTSLCRPAGIFSGFSMAEL